MDATLAQQSLPLLCLVTASVCDLRARIIPNTIPIALLVWAGLATACGWTSTTWPMLAAGLMLALLIGGVMFALCGFGGGDVKLLVALGAVLGPVGLLITLFWTALAGGVLALVAAARGEQNFAYAPAIALGLLTYTLWPDALSSLLIR